MLNFLLFNSVNYFSFIIELGIFNLTNLYFHLKFKNSFIKIIILSNPNLFKPFLKALSIIFLFIPQIIIFIFIILAKVKFI